MEAGLNSAPKQRTQHAETDELSDELGELVTTVARRLRRNSKLRLSTLGISFSQAHVLRTLARASAPMRMSEIARAIEIVPRAVTAIVEALESKGLVRREIDTQDRRFVIVVLTSTAQGLLSELARARSEASAIMFGNMDKDTKKALLENLSSLIAATEHISPSGRYESEKNDGGETP